MSKNYKLVYMLAVKDDLGSYDPLEAHGEFQNRAAAKKYVKENAYILPADVYLIRKETAFFLDRKLDKSEG